MSEIEVRINGESYNVHPVVAQNMDRRSNGDKVDIIHDMVKDMHDVLYKDGMLVRVAKNTMFRRVITGAIVMILTAITAGYFSGFFDKLLGG